MSAASQKVLEIAETQTILREMPIGARLLVRTKKDWRMAVVSQFGEEKATLIVCSPSGKNYRIRRCLKTEIIYDGKFAVIRFELKEDWRANFCWYDFRW